MEVHGFMLWIAVAIPCSMGELNEVQLLTTPQNYAAPIVSLRDNFRYVKHIATLAGANSEISELPLDVVAHAFNLEREQALQIKNNNPFKFLVPPRESELK